MITDHVFLQPKQSVNEKDPLMEIVVKQFRQTNEYHHFKDSFPIYCQFLSGLRSLLSNSLTLLTEKRLFLFHHYPSIKDSATIYNILTDRQDTATVRMNTKEVG